MQPLSLPECKKLRLFRLLQYSDHPRSFSFWENVLPLLLIFQLLEKRQSMTENFSFEAIKEGNVGEYEALFRKYYPSMCVVAYRFVKNQAVAQDLVQDVFIRLWTKKREYATIPNLKTFLYVAVKNLCFNYIRDQKDTIDFQNVAILNLEDHFHNAMLEEETYRLITEAVDRLPAQSARIIRLALEGKQNKEIAELLGISVSTVKTLKYNAISTLRETLKGYFCLFVIILCQK